MLWIILIIGVIFIIGLLARDKGDGFLDTLSSGCGATIGIIVLIIIIGVLILLFSS